MLANILAVGLMASVMSFSPRYVVDNQNDTITFSAEELNNNSYQYLASQLNTPNVDIGSTTITYDNNLFEFDEMLVHDFIQWNYEDNENHVSTILMTLDEENNNYYSKFKYLPYGEIDPIPFTNSMTINDAEWFIANIEEPPSLTLSKYDLNNKKYTYLAEQLNSQIVYEEDLTNINNTSITYNNMTFTYDEFIIDDILTYAYQNDEIYLILDNENDFYGHWFLKTEIAEGETPFTTSMTINNAQWFLDNINAPLDSGDMMTAITSGLPLMASLAQAFLNGFTSIFWNSTTSSLTTFSMFALIMLSVAIVFACIKLVLNVVRSNTGV